jgi:predicted RecB family nuclease
MRKLTHFSQSSLQDYRDCPRRFELRYLRQLKWPAVETEPMLERERHLQQGATFHQMAQQLVMGIPAERLNRMTKEEPLSRWWTNFVEYGLVGLPENRQAEVTLSAPLGGVRLVAKYDLLAVEAGERLVIVDWKTSQKRTRREVLAERLQTVIYRYVLTEAGAVFNDGKPVQPEQIEMVYWFAEYPDQPERFSYDVVQHERDRQTLTGLLEEIDKRTVFDLTEQTRLCEFCTYRSLCQRGIKAGNWLDVDDELEQEIPDFDFEQIAEIEF